MKITKEIARGICEGLLKPKKEACEKLGGEFASYAIEVANKSVPKDVMEVFRKHRDYIRTSTYLLLRGPGLNDVKCYASIDGVSLCPSEGSYTKTVLVENESVAKKLVKLNDAWCNANKKVENLEDELYNTLLSLGTSDKVGVHLPEAIPFLPEEKTKALVVDLKKIRKAINDPS